MKNLGRLSEAPVGMPMEIKWCFVDGAEGSSIESYGLVEGARVKVLSSCFGNVIVAVNEKRIALGEEIARKIRV